jgi:8-oxo-dGTP pyrophosphatase MutT (NUDIX family)
VTVLTSDERARLERLLVEHEPWDEIETRHLKTTLAFVAALPNPFDRAHESGHITGSAFVVDTRDRILLTHHARLGIWVQLGGHAEDERCAEAVALREAREESGLRDLRTHASLRFSDGSARLLDVDVHRIPARGAEPAHDHHDLRFLLQSRTPETIVGDPAETKGLEWLTLAEARGRCDAGMLRALAKIDRALILG